MAPKYTIDTCSFTAMRRVYPEDVFVIAAAIVHGCSVVTEEKPSGGPGKVKIPDVCKALKIECLNMLGMLRREGMRLE